MRLRAPNHMAGEVSGLRHLLVGWWCFVALVASGCLGIGPDDGWCGNDILESGEECDGLLVAPSKSATSNCRQWDGRDAPVPCTRGCSLDYAACQELGTCGDGILQPAFEDCDRAAPPPGTCEARGYDGGELRCAVGCWVDTSGCVKCGDGRVSPENGEVCDLGAYLQLPCTTLGMGYGDGVVSCPGCTRLDLSDCDPAHYQVVESHHRVTAAVTDGAGGIWRLGFVTGALTGLSNAAADCPARFESMLEASPWFHSNYWDLNLRISDCHDLFLERLDADSRLVIRRQFGTPWADVPATLLRIPDGRLAVFAWHVQGPVVSDGVRAILRLHVFDAAGRLIHDRDLEVWDYPLENQIRPQVMFAGQTAEGWHLLVNLRLTGPLPVLAILSGGWDKEPVLRCAWESLSLPPRPRLRHLQTLKAGWAGAGAFLLVLRGTYMEDSYFYRTPVDTLLRLEPGEGSCTVSWQEDFPSSSTFVFSPPEESGVVWAYEDRSDAHETGREWRLTATGLEVTDAIWRMHSTEKPLYAFRRDDHWLLTGRASPGMPVPWEPECSVICEQAAWQAVLTPGAYPVVGRGWHSRRAAPGSLVQVLHPDGSWTWTGTYDLNPVDPSEGRSYVIRLPADSAF